MNKNHETHTHEEFQKELAQLCKKSKPQNYNFAPDGTFSYNCDPAKLERMHATIRMHAHPIINRETKNVKLSKEAMVKPVKEII